jgi:Transglutaminase-like superfamily
MSDLPGGAVAELELRRARSARLAAVVRADAALQETLRRPLAPAAKVALAAEIAVSYVRVRRQIRKVRLPELLEHLREGIADRGVPAWSATDEHVAAARLARAVMRLLPRLPGDTRCLTQSLVLTAVLARRGIGSTLIISVSPSAGFKAHAWVEHGGVPLLPADDASYGRLVTL